MSELTIGLIEELGQRYPSIRLLIDEHTLDNFGEILPHLSLGNLPEQLYSYLITLAIRGESTCAVEQSTEPLLNEQSIRSLLDDLEHAYNHGEQEIQELIFVSFLENLLRSDEEASRLREWLGPTLRAELRLMG